MHSEMQIALRYFLRQEGICMETIDELQKEIVEFGDKRDWKQFHNPKDLAISISLEAAELLDVFILHKDWSLIM